MLAKSVVALNYTLLQFMSSLILFTCDSMNITLLMLLLLLLFVRFAHNCVHFYLLHPVVEHKQILSLYLLTSTNHIHA